MRKHRKAKLNLVHINIRSVHKHWDEKHVYSYNQTSKFDVIILTETNIGEKPFATFNTPDFFAHNLCRDERRNGGTVVVFIKTKYMFHK